MSSTQEGGDLHPFVAQLLADTATEVQMVLSLAESIDIALDRDQGYGTTICETSLSAPEKFGELANLSSAAFALAALEHNRRDTRKGPEVTLNEAIHSGWGYAVVHGREYQTEEDRERRLGLVAKPFWRLPPKEQVKDEVACIATQEWFRRYLKVAAREAIKLTAEL